MYLCCVLVLWWGGFGVGVLVLFILVSDDVYRFPVISSASEYRSSLLSREVQCWLFGERVKNPSLHPVMRGSVNAVAETYKLAEQQPEVGSVVTSDGRWVDVIGVPTERWYNV